MRDRTLLLVAVAGFMVLSDCGKPSATRPPGAFTHTFAPSRTSAQPGDGYIPEGQSISPYDDANPALANLDPDLRSALQDAAKNAHSAGIILRVNSGWRSAKYQQLLLDRAISTYGNEQKARRYVNTPEKSAHVRGEAVDLGPTDADSRLAQHGREYGLCQTYANEMWHFERTTTPGGACPAMIADATAG
jgi:D-alanyl-D-alanine carboxypeptidase